jgi:hypothetical protein
MKGRRLPLTWGIRRGGYTPRPTGHSTATPPAPPVDRRPRETPCATVLIETVVGAIIVPPSSPAYESVVRVIREKEATR